MGMGVIKDDCPKLIHYNLFPNGNSGRFVRFATGPFSNFSTPRGQTAEQIPQPTQEERTMF
jgi:hypothetical protein